MKLAPLSLCALALTSSAASAHVRLLHPSNGNPLRWSAPQAVSLVIQAQGSSDLGPLEHLPALRNAIGAWNAVEGTPWTLVENDSPSQMNRSDWGSNSLHMLLFDEDGSSGYFPQGSGLVALTLVWFSGSGTILDADVLFNGRDHSFSTSGAAWHFDVQDVATHELGHLAGLDHSGVAGATLYPYVDPAEVLHRSLSLDEAQALRSIYPQAAGASLEGRLVRSGGSPVRGAHVVVRDAAGRTFSGTLSDANGDWSIQALPAGDYALYATPLDQPVSASNLGPGHVVDINFSTTELGSFSLSSNTQSELGTQSVAADAPLLLGRSMESFPRRITRGTIQTITLLGSGLTAACSLICSDPTVLVTPLAWNTTSVQLRVDATAASSDGHFDLSVLRDGLMHTLVGGLELAPPNPELSWVDPNQASSAGGTLVTIHGAGFRSGMRVVIGEHVYVEGHADGCELLDANRLRLRLRSSLTGTRDVVVIDPSGVEGRLSAALSIASLPVLQAVFPPAGYEGGGTQLVLRGSQFESGCTVSIDGVLQPLLVRESAQLLRVTTTAGISGGPYVLRVSNPSGGSCDGSYSYTKQVDPLLAALEPQSGPSSGGETVYLHGENFPAGCRVYFGVDPWTGVGGKLAPSVLVRESGVLEVLTPAHSSGSQSVLVVDPETGQSTLLASAYTFHGSSGGGACSVQAGSGPAGPSAALGWLLALGALLWRSRGRRMRLS